MNIMFYLFISSLTVFQLPPTILLQINLMNQVKLFIFFLVSKKNLKEIILFKIITVGLERWLSG